MSEQAPRLDYLRWRFGDAVLDESALSLTLAGLPVEIEPRPLELLIFLLRRSGEVCTKAELLEALWPGRVVTEGSLTNCVAKLRQVLGDTEQIIVRTVYGYGYRLGVPVRVEAVEAAASSSRLKLEAGMAIPRRSGWTLVEKLGEGGSGEVWLGRGKTGEPRVFKFSQTPELLVSLKREVTLSRLLQDALGERADLVPVLDWNFDEPPYYLETEYWPAGNLAQWVSRQSVLPALEARLEWIAQAAEALAAAHALGVLHKDLKPSNLLVREGDGGIRIALGDWGSGRVLDFDRLRAAQITRLGFTRTQAGIDTSGGTPGYRAPEVTAGQPATIQADLYALGVMLYQLLVGDLHKPLAPGWERDIDDELLREDIAQTVDGNPAQRLADAAELARRLRTLDERRAARTVQREQEREAAEQKRLVERWQARRAWVFASFAFLALGLIASLTLYRRAENRAAEARAQTVRAEATQEFLLEVFYAGDRQRADRPPQERSAKDLLDDNVDRLATDLADQPGAQLDLLRAARRIYGQWNEQARFRSVAARMVELSEQLYGAGDPRTLEELLSRMDAEMNAADLVAAQATVEDAGRRIAAHGLTGTPVHAHQLYLGTVLVNDPARYPQVKQMLEQALGIWRRLRMTDHNLYTPAASDLAAVTRDLGDPDGARGHYREAIRYENARPAENRNDAALGNAWVNLAGLELLSGDVAAAESAFQTGLDLIDRTYGDTWAVGWVRQSQYAEFLHRKGKLARAHELFATLLPKVQDEGINPNVVAMVLESWAGCLLAEGRASEAAPLLQRVVSLWGQELKIEASRIRAQELLARAHAAAGNADEARRLRSELRALPATGDASREQSARAAWARQLLEDGQPAEARALLETLIATAGEMPANLAQVQVQDDLALALSALGEHASALQQSEAAEQALSRLQAFHDVRIATRLWRSRAQIHAAAGDTAQAQRWCRQALEASRLQDHPQSSTRRESCQ